MIVDGVTKASFDELVEIETNDGERRLGKVLEIGYGKAVVQVFEGTTGLAITGTKVKFLGKTMTMPVSQELLVECPMGLADQMMAYLILLLINSLT